MQQHFSLWAPYAQAVRLVQDPEERTTTLAQATELVARGELPTEELVGTGDYWQTAEPVETTGYFGFQLYSDSGWSQVLPDPRSQRQPHGVHGLSAQREDIDPHVPSYKGKELAGQVIYELHVGTFSERGDFAGVIEKLPYLKSLGITAIELMPIQPFGGTRNWGYDGVDWFAVHEAYGGAAGLAQLVRAAHEQDIAVILDVVYNHFGPDGNYTGFFGPYSISAETGWGDVLNLSGPDSDPVRQYILDAVRQWLADFSIDGLRLDAVHAFADTGAIPLLEQMQQIADEVAIASGNPRYLIAESDLNDPRLLNPTRIGGFGLAGQWVDDIHHSVHALISGEDQAYYRDYANAGVAGLAKSLAGMFFFDNTYSSFRKRSHGRRLSAENTPAQGVTYTTTHDQTGNRAIGDRPSQNLTPAQLALRAASIFLSPYTPMLFMGEEFAAQTPFPFFVDHEDSRLLALTREGRLREFARHGWEVEDVCDPTDPEVFSSAHLNWDFDAAARTMFEVYQQLLALRAQHELGKQNYRDFKVRWGTAADTAHDAAELLGKPVTGGAGWLSIVYKDLVFIGNYQDVSAEVHFDVLGIDTPSTLQLVDLAGAHGTFDHGVVKLPAWGFAVLQRPVAS
ncbi:MAG: malto-oligosyltrehalose trehalohydrolase [Corynebacterium sp.]|nr:malto-oligosyltrehalose trehalohydrolase [Corynebacterium sp.]